MPLTSFPVRVAALALALATSQGATARLAAQRSVKDARLIEGYRMTMPVLRKVLPAINAAPASCQRRERRDPHTLSIADMTRALEQCAPVMRALRRAGVHARDAAIVFASMLRTSQAVAMQGGKAGALPPGPIRDNALLLEQNEGELRRLSHAGGQS